MPELLLEQVGSEQFPERAATSQGEIGAVRQEHVALALDEGPILSRHAGANGPSRRLFSHYSSDYLCAGESSLWLFNQMMVQGVANQFGGGCELQLVLKTGAIGTDGLDAESEGLCDVLDGPTLG